MTLYHMNGLASGKSNLIQLAYLVPMQEKKLRFRKDIWAEGIYLNIKKTFDNDAQMSNIKVRI